MVQKRRFDDDEVLEVSSKLPRQLGHSNQLVSFSESVFPEDTPQIPHKLEGGFGKGNAEVDEKLSNGIFTELPSAEDTEASVPGCISISSWATSSTSEEDFWLGAPVHGSCFPDYFHAERPTRTLSREYIYSILLDGPPRKRVPIGPNHQADIPAWSSQGTKATSNHLDTSEAISDSNPISGDEDEKRLMGTCVIPMPDLELSSCNGVKVGNGRIDCSCEDGGSVRCVRQHIMEAREKLLKNIGLERFVELGFDDMGEHVTQKWNEEEEYLFNEIVFSNLASLGKNFWKNLSIVFSSRTKKEIVSYYFNVFMLRRRAEQNRRVPMNIDSDNDEWQGSDDYGDNELGMTEEDEDSVVESPLYHDDPGSDRSREDDLQENDKDAADGTCDNNVDIASGEGVTNVSEASPKKLPGNCGSSPSILLQDKTPLDESGDGEVQDDSCTSSDSGVASQVTQAKSANGNHWPSGINGLSSGVGHEYMVEPCDTKVWDARFMPCPKNKVDLLSTCSMIEEIFGDGQNLS
ncbi:uncharacterized protein LOC132175319 [Corylus avellana]|uniref:uncharacterized protein LOC132175319 n=1 Tax=Corylus avellana TaxID=13451 RepID=UPI001E1F4B63|nr:uncharacterized protein LOC132175319 [Corylus avellana]